MSRRTVAWIALSIVGVFGPASLAVVSLFHAPTAPTPAVDDAHLIWLLVAAMLVFLMQIGFLTFESASVQPKNAQGVAVKNFLNFIAASGGYLLVGFGFMFGDSWGGHGLIGMTRFPWSELKPLDFCLLAYQSGFAAVAATIVSSALVERSRIIGNAFFSFFVGAVLYPMFGHWVWFPWGSVRPIGWLGSLGFHDFAGSSVVHCLGGFAALAGVLVLGPRREKPGAFAGNLPLSTIGVLFLWIGWVGFNGGSATDIQGIGRVILNTNLAAIAGGTSSLLLVLGSKRQGSSNHPLLGTMGGLVAVTAGSLRFSWYQAVAVGALAGLVTVRVAISFRAGAFGDEPPERKALVERLPIGHVASGLIGAFTCWELADNWPRVVGLIASALGAAIAVGLYRELWLRRFAKLRIDDPVDAIAVHGFAGAFGTVMVGLLSQNSLAKQILGTTVAIAWSFGAAYVVFWLLKVVGWLQVSESEEQKGVELEGLPFEPLPLWTQWDKLAEVAEKDKLLTKQIREARESLTRHMVNVSHQVVGPMRGVRGLLGGLRDSTHDLSTVDERIVAAITFTDIAIFRATNMELLARVENPALEQAKRSTFALGDVATDVCHTLRPLAVHQDCKLNFLPSPDPRVLMTADENLIRQALMNLIDNAIHYADKKTSIDVWIEAQETTIAAHVKNLSSPIEEPDRERIFDREHRGRDASSRRPDGSGMGLYIVRQIAKLHKGTIVLVKHDDEKLIEFRLDLPRE